MKSGTIYQLLAFMESDGWHWERLPAAGPRRDSLSYRDGGEKVWYTVGQTVVRSYLQALLSAGSLAARWGFQAIPHGRIAEVYEGLLRGEVVPERRYRRHMRARVIGALEADTEVAPADALNAEALPVPLMLPAPDIDACETSDDGDENKGPPESRPADGFGDFQESVADEGDVGLMGDGVGDGTTAADLVDDLADPPPAPMQESAPIPDAPAGCEAAGEDGHISDAAADAGAMAQLGQPPEAGRRAVASFEFQRRWGCFRFTNFRSGRHGAIEAQCPFHALNARSGCKKRCVIPGPTAEDFERTMQRLRWWCVQATDHQRQFEHVYLSDIDAPPSAENIEALCPQEGPSERVVTDQEFYGLAPEDTTSRGRAKAKAAAKLGAAGKSAAAKSTGSAAKRRPAREEAIPESVAVEAGQPRADGPGSASSSSSSSSGSSSSSARPGGRPGGASPSPSSSSGSAKSDDGSSSD